MQRFNKSFTAQEPIGEDAIEAAVKVMRSGRLHRYNKDAGEQNDVDLLELEFSRHLGSRYALAVSSCGFSLQLALRSTGVTHGTPVLCNSFTLSPVPGAIENCGATCILVETGDDLTVDINDLKRAAEQSGARHLLLSHMRGHIADMDKVMSLCRSMGIRLIEDCAHTMGARWNGKPSGTFGDIGCYSTQTYKHINSGEGGLIVTDDEDIMARCVLMSGSYMLYDYHHAAPGVEAFEALRWTTPNFSGRMDNLRAAVLRPQLAQLDHAVQRWNRLYHALASFLSEDPEIRLAVRDPREEFVGSSIQFFLPTFTSEMMNGFIKQCENLGVTISWFGKAIPTKYTSSHDSWQFIANARDLPHTRKVLSTLCDLRLPLTFSVEDCNTIAGIIKHSIANITAEKST